MTNNSNVQFIDASEWMELPWYSSGGTRAKRVLQSPEGTEWYFKCSEKKLAKDGKPAKYYKYEFWSEIIAYQLGKQMGLDILQYDVAVNNNEVGCISPLMIIRDEEQLIELGRYMTSLTPNFFPEDNSTRAEYTFQLLEETVKAYNLNKYLPIIFQTLIFDAIVGNTDRHQENWAFIGKISLKWVYDITANKLNSQGERIRLQSTSIIKMAPIYDTGSSLGRELTDERVHQLLNDHIALTKYVENGKAEVHWNNRKLTHFELIANLKNSPYLVEFMKAAQFLERWDEQLIGNIVSNIDKALPENWHSYCIPDNRKELIIKLLLLRSQKLKELLHD